MVDGVNLCDIKIMFVKEIIVCFYLDEVVEGVYQDFIQCFQKNVIFDDMLEVIVSLVDGEIVIGNLLKEVGLVGLMFDVMCMIK